MPWASTFTAASCGWFQCAPGRVASRAATWAASTSSYTSRCAPEKRPFTGKLRVMSDA